MRNPQANAVVDIYGGLADLGIRLTSIEKNLLKRAISNGGARTNFGDEATWKAAIAHVDALISEAEKAEDQRIDALWRACFGGVGVESSR